MFAFNVKDSSLPGGQFYLNVPVSNPEMYVFRSIADVRSPTYSRPQTSAIRVWSHVESPACSDAMYCLQFAIPRLLGLDAVLQGVDVLY